MLVFSGLVTEYLDESAELEPFTDYEYKVTAFNSRGQISSQWSRVRTATSTPQHVPAPTIVVRALT